MSDEGLMTPDIENSLDVVLKQAGIGGSDLTHVPEGQEVQKQVAEVEGKSGPQAKP